MSTRRLAVILFTALTLVAAACGDAADSSDKATDGPGKGESAAASEDDALASEEGADTANDHGDNSSSPADPDTTWPIDPATAGHTDADGHHTCTAPVTPEQQVAADDLRIATTESIQRFATMEAALAEGYRFIAPPLPGSIAGSHYLNDTYYTDGVILDPQRPEALMYKGDQLQGAMFLMPDTLSMGPQVGGCLTQWHSHDDLCLTAPFDQGGVVVWLTDFGPCPQGSQVIIPPDMLHVWIIPHPEGPFAGLET